MSEGLISYDYLEDGQSHMTLVQWRSRLQRDATGALSVLRRRGTEILERARETSEMVGSDVFSKSLQLIEARVRSAIVGIPQGGGIFSGFSTAEREKAFGEICLFLNDLHSHVTDLQMRIAFFEEERGKNVYALETDFLSARQDLLTVRQAASELEMQDVTKACSSLLDRLDAAERQWSVALLAERERENTVKSFCCYISTDFIARLFAEADMEHDGASASPAAILRSLGALRDRAGQLCHGLSRFENTAPMQDDGERT